MRSSKSRSRNKNNRNRPSGGNVINRVFDSSGPEGKVRGTPQQIIEKYNQLARDAQLSGDRVATENFQQHAEHYTRMLAEAMREQQERQDRQQQQGGNTSGGGSNRGEGGSDHQNYQQNQNRQDDQGRQDDQNRRDDQGGQNDQARADDQSGGSRTDEAQGGDRPRRNRRSKPVEARDDDVIDTGAPDSGLVETPEEKPRRSRRSRQKAEVAEAQPTPDAAE